MKKGKGFGPGSPSEHGVSIPEGSNGFQFIDTGISARSGKPTIYCPTEADILIIQNGRASLSTPGHMFTVFPFLGTTEEYLYRVSQLKLEDGYHVANHITQRNRFLGKTWKQAHAALQGNYLSDRLGYAIQETPPDPEVLTQIFLSKAGL